MYYQGRNAVAIAIDSRFGLGMQTISTLSSSGDNSDNYKNHDNNNSGNPRILLLPNSNTLLAWTGLYGDGLGFSDEISVLLAGKVRRAGGMRFDGSGGFSGTTIARRKTTMNPRAIAMLMSHLLYRRRNAPYYVEPVIVGLETVQISSGETDCKESTTQSLIIPTVTTTNEVGSAVESSSISRTPEKILQCKPKNKSLQRPYLCTTDMLGAQSTSNSFVCSGVASRSLHGTAEALWRPNLEGDELVEICGRAFISALERDCYSGYGVVVYLIQGNVERDADDNTTNNDDGNDETDVRIVEYILSCRND